MSADNFKPSLVVILKEEGGNDDDPNDHGGRTSRGIIQREWDVYTQSHPDLPGDVWRAPQADIDAIYHDQYWEPYCDKLPVGLDLVFFNACVNSGRQQAVKELQRALGVSADGMMGMLTLQAVADCADVPELIRQTCDRRRAFYKALAQFPRYGRGWMARTDRVETTALHMSMSLEVTHPAVDTMPDNPAVTVSAKAHPGDTSQPMVSTQTASAGTLAGTFGSSVSDQLQQAQTALTPLQDAFVWAKYICIGLTVICAGLAIYAVIHNRQTQAVT